MDRLKNSVQKNKGLTLVELIVALAIFAIAGLAIYGFVSFSTRSFTESNRNVKLQYEQQVVVNRVKDIILETSRGVSYNPAAHKLLVLSDNPNYDPTITDVSNPNSVKSIITQLRWDEDSNKLYVGEYKTSASKLSDITISSDNEYELGENLSFFDADLSKLEKGQVTLTMTFKTGDKEVTVNPVISLRNLITKVDDDTDLEDLYSEVVVEMFSHVAKVEIYRDGRVLPQNKVETIALAGSSSSAVFTAVVTAKKDYESKINKECDWSVDLSTVSEGYEECIAITTGTDGDGNTTCKVTVKESGGKKPSDYMKNGYLTLVATSKEDNTRSGRLRIKVTTDGAYPESITSTGYDSFTADVEHGQIKYKVSHVIKYTGNVEVPSNPGTYANELSGDDAYKKISYKITDVIYNGSKPDKALTKVPAGAGFTATNAVDGVFVATKSMEEHTFKVRVTVTQRGKDGEEVYDEFEISIPKDVIPEPIDSTKPIAYCDELVDRANILDLSGIWSSGVPEYEKNGSKHPYKYWFEWEIDMVDTPENWNANNDKYGVTSFDNLYFCSIDSNISNGNIPSEISGWETYNAEGRRTYTDINNSNKNDRSSQAKSRSAKVYCRHYLDWQKKFTFRVRLRVKISETDSIWDAKYFMLPGTDPANPDNVMADGIGQAYASTKYVTIYPVEMRLSPSTVKTFDKDGNVISEKPVEFCDETGGRYAPYNAVFNHSHTIGWGKDSSYDAYSNGYYKIFTPKFTGINVSMFNVNSIGEIAGTLTDNNSSLRSYRKGTTGSIVYSNETVGDTYKQGIVTEIKRKVNNNVVITRNLYFYLQMLPYKWKNANQFPDGCVWTCQFTDMITDNGKRVARNYVVGIFDDNKTSSDYQTKTQWGDFANEP